MTRLRFLSVVLITGAVFPVMGADATCKMLADVNAKIYSIPTHIYSVETAAFAGGKSRSSELIYLNNTTYIQVNGTWTISKATPKSMVEMHKDAMTEHPNATCKLVRDEALNGESTSLYSMHEQTPDAKVDSQIWISKSRGLPVKSEIDIDAGGAAGKSHRTMRYEYTNVKAPDVKATGTKRPGPTY